MQWSSASTGTFTTHVQVPAIPWVTAEGVKPLVTGAYAIGVQCVVSVIGCSGRPADATASFRLTGPVPSTCTAGLPCGRLVLSPSSGPPGTLVHISGWAPLGAAIGTPSGFYLGVTQDGRSAGGLGIGQVQQEANGDLSGTVVVPPSASGLGQLASGTATLYAFSVFSGTNHVTVARASFQVETAPTWAALGRVQLALVQQAKPDSTATESNRVARCLPGGNIELSTDSGRSWTTVPTAVVVAALKGTPYSVTWGDVSTVKPPACATVALQPGGGAIFAAFGGVTNGTAPPILWFPLVSRDGGQSWHLLPAPAGYKPSDFSRFQVQGSAVLALFWNGHKPDFGLEQSADGGQNWSPGHLACPATGPCVTWGPVPDWTWPGIGNCQAVLVSTDNGANWTASASVCYVGTGPSGPYELVTLPDGRVLLLGDATYPVRVSADGGHSWTAVSVPRLPGQSATAWYPAVSLLGDGTLGAKSTGNLWWALPPGATAWCAATLSAGEAVGPDTTLSCAAAPTTSPSSPERAEVANPPPVTDDGATAIGARRMACRHRR